MDTHTYRLQLDNIFKVLDRDARGYITKEDMKDVFTAVRRGVSDDEVNEMLRAADTNGNGKVDCMATLVHRSNLYVADNYVDTEFIRLMNPDKPTREEEQAPIHLEDAVGRRFNFPFHLVRTWTVSC